MYKIITLLVLMMTSSEIWCSCLSITAELSKKIHPDLAMGPAYGCEDTIKGNDIKIVAMLYFSDTKKQTIHYPIYDMDILLVNTKSKEILSHYHEKEMVQEMGTDIVPSREYEDAQNVPFEDIDYHTHELVIENGYALNSKIKAFSVFLNRVRTPGGGRGYYSEHVLNLYYLKENQIYKILDSLQLRTVEDDIVQGFNIKLKKEKDCPFKMSKKSTMGFYDLIINEKKRTEKIFFNSDDKKTRISHHRYILKFNGQEYKVPPTCKARLII